MDTNSFDDDEDSYSVFLNNEEQHSLWPAFADGPVGWRVVCGEADRTACLDYVERNWTNIRANSLGDLLARGSQP
jgi:uncharacterized protein YbdZ (MbtH family)